MWLIIALIVVGVLLLVAELVLLPGISVAGIGAFIAFLAAAFYGFMQYGVMGGALILATIVILCVIAVVVSLRANTWRRFSLKATVDSTSTPTPEQQDIHVGQRGETLTRLAPMGKVRTRRSDHRSKIRGRLHRPAPGDRSDRLRQYRRHRKAGRFRGRIPGNIFRTARLKTQKH